MAKRVGERDWKRTIEIGVPFVWLVVLFLVPFFIVLKVSLSTGVIAMPPYEPAFDFFADGVSGTIEKIKSFSLANYTWLFGDPLYLNSYLSSLRIAAISTILLLLIGYPIAYGMARAPKDIRPMLLMMVILPFWTSFLIRVYAWIGILKPEGLLSTLLIWLGLIDEPLAIMNTEKAVFIGIVYSYLPFMVLPLYSSLEKLDGTLLEAAADLGATPIQAFWKITFPLSIPGIVAGCMLCFIPAVGEFVIPDLLGGNETLMIGRVLWNEFFLNRDWPVSSAVAVLLLLVLVIPIVFYQNFQQRQLEADR
ncbi:putrescine/spermidine ABC transporter permease [Terrihabitans soli]|uniref:Putrescine/spermidine ABC transporter permease n=1 Tax=Terrihabitans soli TaxID=708113 RepID=A0A6S6QKK8_9HYPH|nr:ABC transporter permease subunit [Terrihabitans soli]BCJ91843.1 putrescine/spermidine ABC transporter permease [Terrihabitans soli]